jgi:hypothetical protein
MTVNLFLQAFKRYAPVGMIIITKEMRIANQSILNGENVITTIHAMEEAKYFIELWHLYALHLAITIFSLKEFKIYEVHKQRTLDGIMR